MTIPRLPSLANEPGQALGNLTIRSSGEAALEEASEGFVFSQGVPAVQFFGGESHAPWRAIPPAMYYMVSDAPAEDEIRSLREEIVQLRESLEIMKTQLRELLESTVIVTQLTTLGHEVIALDRPIPVTIRRDEGTFIASFLEANVSSGGDTIQAAITNLQSAIVDFVLMHLEDGDENLGPMMQQQRNALMDVIWLHSQRFTPKRQSKNFAKKLATA